jgi:hypothetical protein
MKEIIFPAVEDLGTVVLGLQARVEELEGKYETQRLATLEWGKDVDQHTHWLDKHHMRIAELEKSVPLPTPFDDPPAPGPADSLVECVAWAGDCPSRGNARDAIREVAAWMRKQGTPALGWAMRLEQEAER